MKTARHGLDLGRVQRLPRKLAAILANLGLPGLALYVSQRLGLPLGRHGAYYTLRARYATSPLLSRRGTSDLEVFSDLFVHRAYAVVDELDEPGLILDCGANVGYASAYFLSRFPDADVVAVEPDRANFEMLQRNTRPYGDRVATLQSAVWSHPTTLVVEDDAYRDGREWSRQVREARADDARGFDAVDIATLLAESGHERIGILKIDIEGAEGVVFSEHFDAWLPKVDVILIELHDDSSFGDCTSIFHRAIADEDFAVSQTVNLTVCKRRARRRDSRPARRASNATEALRRRPPRGRLAGHAPAAKED